MIFIPLIAFWILVFVGRNVLRWKGVVIAVAIWIGLLLVCGILGLNPYWFVAAQAIIDCILVLVILGGDVMI